MATPTAHAAGPAVVRLAIAALVAALPLFLVSAMAGALGSDGLSAATIGFCFFGYFTVSAVMSPAGSMVVERAGNRSALLVLAGAAAVAMLMIAAESSSTMAVIATAVAGLSNAILQPTVAATVAATATARRRPLLMGAIMAGIPAAALVTGLAGQMLESVVPVREVFLAGALLCLLASAAFLTLPIVHRSDSATRGPRPRIVDAWPLFLGVFLGSIAANALPGFLSATVDDYDLSRTATTVALPIAVLGCVGVRLGAGALLVRSPHRLRLMLGSLLVVGSVGYALMAIPELFFVGLFIAYAGGWGWVGVANSFAVIRHPQHAAGFSGKLQVAVFSGSALGPLAFGLLAEHSFRLGWAVMATAAAAAGVSVVLGLRAGEIARRIPVVAPDVSE